MIDDNVFIAEQSEQTQDDRDFFATIAAVFDDGVSLLIDGVETEKHYKVNSGCIYKAGDNVKVLKIRGTYIVEYVIDSVSFDEAAIALEGSY